MGNEMGNNDCGVEIGHAINRGSVLLPDDRCMTEDRRDCHWLCVATDCAANPTMQEPIKDPARLEWHEVTKVAYYYPSVNAVTQPMQVREDAPPYKT